MSNHHHNILIIIIFIIITASSHSRTHPADNSKHKDGDEPYFFVKKNMAPHRLPAMTDGNREIPPPDFWSRPVANFQTLEQAQRAFDHPHLLHSFFNKMDEILNLVEANAGTIELNTNLARQMIDHCTATIYCYGESGSGKSTLIRALTNDVRNDASHQ